ncbi:trans-sulfuration enzyme family protein [Acetobacter sicerae]
MGSGNHPQFNNPPIYRGASVSFGSMQERREAASLSGSTQRGWTYGLEGSPTHWALEDELIALEGGEKCELYSSGLAAITGTLISVLSSGDHILVPDSVYGPVRRFVRTILRSFGVSTTFYSPCISSDDIIKIFQPNTRLLYLESPGSYTFEVQDVPGLAAAAGDRGIVSIMDNTWGIRRFSPLLSGVDVVVHSATKYMSGHSDVLLGAAIWRSARVGGKIARGRRILGEHVSADDCWLVSRGLKTLDLRLNSQERTAYNVATWLANRPEIDSVRHPALVSCPGHEVWRRDYTGASGVFSVIFAPHISNYQIDKICNQLSIFRIGASWGDTTSLVLPSGDFLRRDVKVRGLCNLVRFSIGLESESDLIEDLQRGFRASLGG